MTEPLFHSWPDDDSIQILGDAADGGDGKDASGDRQDGQEGGWPQWFLSANSDP